jgi:hypothetical protein
LNSPKININVITSKGQIKQITYTERSIIINQFNSVQFFIIYVPSKQLQGQLQTQNSVDISNYIMDKHNIKSKTNYRQALEEKHINAEK